MKKFLLLYIFTCSILLLVGQESVTIDECQQWAVAQTSANVQKDLNGQILKTNLNNAASHLYPKLSINGRLSYESADVPGGEFTIAPFDNNPELAKMQYHIGLDFEQVVFEGCKMFYGRQFATLQNDAEIYKIELSINEIKSQVISLYLNYLIVDKQMGIIDNVRSTFDDQIKQLQVLLKEGVIPKNTLSQLELEALKMEQNYDELKAKRESILSSLSILTGKDLSNVQLAMPQLPDISRSMESSRLEFAIFDNQLQQMEFQRKLHFSSSLPKISLFATGGYGRPDYQFYFTRPDWYYMAGVNLRIPVIDWAKTSGLGKVITIQKSILESQEQDFKKANQIAIQDKLNEIDRIEKLIRLDGDITAKYQSLTKTYSSQLSNGTITVFDYIRQHNDELQSLMNQELHHIQLLKAKYELLALKGQL
ncbi:MAG: TolC family protein [Bacteroidales bacterium]|nr:TolC family protein [Bacteroidales bacterium]